MKKQQCWQLNQKLPHTDEEGRHYGKDEKNATEFYYGIRGDYICAIGRSGGDKGKVITLSKQT
jgi:hypothetical protein